MLSTLSISRTKVGILLLLKVYLKFAWLKIQLVARQGPLRFLCMCNRQPRVVYIKHCYWLFRKKTNVMVKNYILRKPGDKLPIARKSSL